MVVGPGGTVAAADGALAVVYGGRGAGDEEGYGAAVACGWDWGWGDIGWHFLLVGLKRCCGLDVGGGRVEAAGNEFNSGTG